MTPKEVLQFARENECTMVDLKFQDFLGQWQHFTRPIQELSLSRFDEGFGFDASNLRGWQPAHCADMLVLPDPATARVDPFPREKTLHLIGNIRDPATGEPYARDPRHVAQKAEGYLKTTGVADTAWFGPTAEFFVFDDVRFDQTRNSGFYIVDSIEGRWNSGRDEQPNLGYKPRHGEGYFPCPPVDSLSDLRTEMVLELMKVGIEVRMQHHQAGSAGQGAVGLRQAPLVAQGDHLQWLKYILKNVAVRNGKTLTFMPKPLFEDSGSALLVHQSLWKKGHNLFEGDRYGGLSQLALWYVGGLLRHAPALCALCNPTTNSYKRLAAGGDAPIRLGYSTRSRSCVVRVPLCAKGAKGAKTRRVEFRAPDPSCNGYLAFAAMLMAGLDGIENQTDPGDPLNGEAESPETAARTPATLGEALSCLEEDHAFLLKGEVFTPDVIHTWIEGKRRYEVDAVAARPVPWEFSLYYDC